MVQVVTVEQPPAGIVGVEVDRHLPSMPGDDDCVFDRVADLEEVAVEVHRVNDRALVGHPNPDVFVGPNLEWVGVRVGLSVYRPRIGLAGSDRVLRHVWHAVDRVRNGDSVPVNRRLCLEVVSQFDAEHVTLLDA